MVFGVYLLGEPLLKYGMSGNFKFGIELLYDKTKKRFQNLGAIFNRPLVSLRHNCDNHSCNIGNHNNGSHEYAYIVFHWFGFLGDEI